MLGGKAQQRKGLSMLAFSARLLTVVFLIYSPRVGASHAFFDVGLASRRQFDIAVAIQQASSGKGSMDGMAGAQEMMTRLYLGCAKAAQNRTLLEKLKIKSVLIVADDVHPAFPGEFEYMEIPAKDVPSQDLLSKFESAFAFLDKARAQGPVLVHCACGMSRSATVVLGYIMKHRKRGLDATLRTARTKRQICPNRGFLKQLRVFEWAKFDVKADFDAMRRELEDSGQQPSAQIKLLEKLSEHSVRRAVPVGGDQSAVYVQHRRKLQFRSHNTMAFFEMPSCDSTSFPSRNPSFGSFASLPSRAQSQESCLPTRGQSTDSLEAGVPSPGTQEPSLGTQEPSPGTQEPSLGTQEPSLGNQEPSLRRQGPKLGDQGPKLGTQGPSLGSHRPGFGSQSCLAEPRTGAVDSPGRLFDKGVKGQARAGS